MEFEKQLIPGRLIKRYKRFLADIVLEDGLIVTAHCTNSGSMKSCLEEGAEVYLSPVDDPKRKTRFTWEMIRIEGNWVGINTAHPNTWPLNGCRKARNRFGDKRTETGGEWEDSRFDIF